jgi:hypothetical protein
VYLLSLEQTHHSSYFAIHVTSYHVPLNSCVFPITHSVISALADDVNAMVLHNVLEIPILQKESIFIVLSRLGLNEAK